VSVSIGSVQECAAAAALSSVAVATSDGDIHAVTSELDGGSVKGPSARFGLRLWKSFITSGAHRER
jgi:hypothetical protein